MAELIRQEGFFWSVDLQLGLTWIVAYFIPYLMTYIYIPYCIPLCLNRKFRNLHWAAARISEGWIAGKIPWQKWSISNLWEHFLVPEHRIPICFIFKLKLGSRNTPKSLKFVRFYWYFESMNQSQIQKCFKFLRFFNRNVISCSISFPKSLIFLRCYWDFEFMNLSQIQEIL